MASLKLREIEMKVLKQLHTTGLRHRLDLFKDLSNGKPVVLKSLPATVGGWIKRLKAEGLVVEKLSHDGTHLGYDITDPGRSLVL